MKAESCQANVALLLSQELVEMITDLIKEIKRTSGGSGKLRSKKRKRSVQPERTSGGDDKLKRKKRKSRKCDSHPPDASESKKRFYSKHRFLFTEQGKLGFHVGYTCIEDDTFRDSVE